MEHKEVELTPRHHANLFAIIVKNALDTLGKKSEAAIVEGVKRYGRQRGGRMAQRVLADGRKLDVKNYLIYGEWVPAPGEMDIKFPISSGDANMVARKCSWQDEWKKEGTLKYGMYYCDYVDAAIAEGFRSDLVLDLVEHRTAGRETCDFYFRKSQLTEQDLQEISADQKKAGLSVKEDWSYHIGHLFRTMTDELIKEFGEEGKKVKDMSLKDYEKKYSKQVAQDLAQYEKTNFDTIRAYKSVLV